MKRILVFLLVAVFALGMTGTSALAYTQTNIDVVPGNVEATVDGDTVTLDVAAKIINNRTMVPIRFVAESLGFKVEWDNSTKTVTIGENGEIALPIGSYTAKVDGKDVSLDSPAVIESGRTLVPLRFISESFGAEVTWDNSTKTASIAFSDQMEKARSIYGQPVEGEAAMLAALDDKFAYSVATKMASFGDAKDGRGMHLVGSTAGKAAADYAYKTFQEIGLSPKYDTFKATGWEYYGSDMKINGHEDLNYFITSAPHTPATAEGGLTGEIVYVGKATKEELANVDLTGKIALAEFDWDYTLWMNNLEYAVAQKGAAGLIYFCTNGYGTDESGMAEFVGDWSGIAATIPTWSMRQIDGFALAELAEKEKLTATLTSDCKTIENATGYNVMATIKGAKYPDEYVVITAHTDAYFHCLQDDSAPVGLMLAMAKAMVDSGYTPDRTIVFVTTDGEEAGGGDTFYDWLVGSWALVNEKVDEWGGKIVDSHTIEMIGDDMSTNFGYRVSDVMLLFTEAMAYGMNESGDYSKEVSVDNFMTTSSDEWSFSYFGYPTTRTIMENKADEVYHSTMDNPDRFSYDMFKANLKAQSTLIMRVEKQPFAPYDLARDAELYRNSLNAEALKAQGVAADTLTAELDKYIMNAEALIDKTLEMTQVYNDAKSAGKDVAKVDKLLVDYNKAMRQTAETVIRGTQYVGLDTPVNQMEYYQNIPSVFDDAIAVLKAGNAEGLLDALYGLDSDDMGQYTVWYTECMDYNTWKNSYHEALEADPKADYKWVSGILLKYYDVYAVMESVNAKAAAGNTDFSAEISTLQGMKADAQSRVKAAYTTDLGVWQKAGAQLPTAKADAILEELAAL